MSIPITNGTGASSVAAEAVAGLQYQQVEIYGKGGASVLSVNPDGSFNASVIGNVSASIVGQLPAGTASLGSVATLQGTNPWLVRTGGSVIAVVMGSVTGTYAEDSAHVTADKGLFIMGVRNDTLASITSNDGDYSPKTVGPAGETVTANAPITKWVQGTADLRVVLGASVTAIQAQGASVFTYVTGVQVANMGSASVLVTIGGGLGSVLAYTIAPAGGGSNITYTNALKTGENSAVTASISGTASVLVSMQGFTSKT